MNPEKTYNSFVFYLFVLSPLVGFISLSFLQTGYYNLMGALTFGSFILILLTNNNRKLVISKAAVFLFLFFLYTLLSDIFIAHKSLSVKYFYLNRILSSFLILIVIENTTVSKQFIKNSVFIIKIILITSVVVIILQQLVNKDLFVQNYYYENYSKYISTGYVLRLPSIFSWTSVMDIGTTAIPLFSVLLSIALYEKKKYYWFWLVLGMGYSFLTKARWIMLGMIVVSLMIPIYKKVNFVHFFKYVIIVVTSLIITIQGLKFIGIDVTDIIYYRILEADKSTLEKKSAGTRIFAFKVFSDLYPQNPVFGKGMLHSFSGKSKDTKLVLETKGRTSQIHVGYLSLFYYYGAVGGLLYLLFLWYLMRSLYDDAKKHRFWGGFFGMMLLVTSNLTLVSLPLFYSGFVIALVYNKYRKQQIN